MPRGNKSFINRSYRINGEPDLNVKDRIRKACRKYDIYLTQDKVTNNNGSYNNCDLIDTKRPFIVESDGSWHQTKKGHQLTLRRIQNYKELGIPCAIYDPELAKYLEKCEDPYERYMAPILQTFNVNEQWGVII